jgi:NitT/TauT family transport system permease protein
MKISIWNKLLLFTLGFISIGILWEVAFVFFGSSLILPSLKEVFEKLLNIIITIKAWQSLSATIGKAFFGLFLALFIGVPLGFLVGFNPFIEHLFFPGLIILKSVPLISWLTSILILWGIGWQAPVFIVFITLLPVIIYNIAYGVKTVDKQLLEIVRLVHLPIRKAITGIYLPSLVPFLISSVEISIGTMWKSAIAAEFLAGESGIGVQIAWSKYYVDTPTVFAFTLFAIIIGLIIEFTLKWIFSGSLFKRWKGIWEF